jgi:hypothetical protein
MRNHVLRILLLGVVASLFVAVILFALKIQRVAFRPGPGKGPSEKDCQKLGGEVRYHLGGSTSCSVPTSDAGKPCTELFGQCVQICEVTIPPSENRIVKDGYIYVTGTCSRWTNTGGSCYYADYKSGRVPVSSVEKGEICSIAD